MKFLSAQKVTYIFLVASDKTTYRLEEGQWFGHDGFEEYLIEHPPAVKKLSEAYAEYIKELAQSV